MKKLYNKCPNGQIIELFFWFFTFFNLSKKRLNVNKKSYSQVVNKLWKVGLDCVIFTYPKLLKKLY